MITLALGLSNDDRIYALPTEKFILFTNNVTRVIQNEFVERIIVLWREWSTVELWRSAWDQITPSTRVQQVEFREIGKSDETSLASSAYHSDMSAKNDMQQIDKAYVIVDKPAVMEFLRTNQFLAETLLEVAGYVCQYFDIGRPKLTIQTDPEYSSFQEIVIRVPIQGPPEAAISRLSMFRRKYWLNQPFEIRRIVAIRYETGD